MSDRETREEEKRKESGVSPVVAVAMVGVFVVFLIGAFLVGREERSEARLTGEVARLMEAASFEGRTVRLTAEVGSVYVSARADRWIDEDILVRVPDGTEATVVGSTSFEVAPGTHLTRYQVRLNDGSTGWVSRVAVEGR